MVRWLATQGRWWRLAICLTLLCGGGTAAAHKPSDSYLRLTLTDSGHVDGQWDIALRDLEFAIGLDRDGDGAITWGELRARHADIAAYALSRLVVRGDSQPCGASAGEQLVDEHTDGAYTVLRFRLDCGAPPRRLQIAYSLFADIDPQHRGLLNLAGGGGVQTAVLDPQAAPVAFDAREAGRFALFASFLREGVWHIWIGLDHVLFLLALLLPAVLVRQQGAWTPVPGLRGATIEVVKIVSAFTAAHSITLSLAALGVVELPSRLVEATIAASVVLAAVNNLVPLVHAPRWTVAFAFGLVHGFGFASVLADLGLPQQALVLALVAFNLGVECGQLGIVALFLPLAYRVRGTAFYRSWVLQGGSTATALLAALWFIERAFDIELLKW